MRHQETKRCVRPRWFPIRVAGSLCSMKAICSHESCGVLYPSAGSLLGTIIATVASGAWLAAVTQPCQGQPVPRVGDHFDGRRVTADGRLASFPRETCPTFNRYKYGLEDANDYVGSPDGVDLARRYARRDVAYLLGSDTDPCAPNLDTTCAAAAHGASRRERGERYFHYLQLVIGREVGRHH